jgi:hypothetical protein
MGSLVNRPLTIALSWLIAGLIVSLNVLLLAVTFSSAWG